MEDPWLTRGAIIAHGQNTTVWEPSETNHDSVPAMLNHGPIGKYHWRNKSPSAACEAIEEQRHY